MLLLPLNPILLLNKMANGYLVYLVIWFIHLPLCKKHSFWIGSILFNLRVFCVCAYSLSHVGLCDPLDCSLPGSSVHGDSPGKNTPVGCHTLLQGIFPTQGSNPGLPHYRWILYHLSHQGSPIVLYRHAKSSLPRISLTIFSNWENPTYSSETMITFNVSPFQLSQDKFFTL